MATVKCNVFFEFQDSAGDWHRGGDLKTPQGSVTVDGACIDRTINDLADTTTVDIWDSSDPVVTDFDWLYVDSTQAVFLELVVDRGAEVGTVVLAQQICANGQPYILDSDTAKANYTVDFAAGSDDVIDQIRIRNESGSTADVRFVIVT